MELNPTQAVCPVCQHLGAVLVQKYRYTHPAFANCRIVQCTDCGLYYAYPVPSAEQLSSYNSNYFSNAHGGVSQDQLTVAFHSAINLLRVVHVEQFADREQKNIRRVLEIGPGAGHFVKHWLERHPDTSDYVAIESDNSCHPQLRQNGATVFSDLGTLPLQPDLFDLVVISHVLEHTENPAGFLSACVGHLREGGILFIEVPCLDFRHKSIDEPHLLFFDKAPMLQLLSRTGFGSVKLSYHGNTIAELQKQSKLTSLFTRIRNLLLRKKILFLFGSSDSRLKDIADPLAKAVIKPFAAHKEQATQSWWLRAVAIKQ
ncbi:MAG: class I SAM-dependent methyltransferase [Chitinophagaceae bacterium]|nr:class I SAM-dependent methyltransferase [Chitinophagaceae bacterium]